MAPASFNRLVRFQNDHGSVLYGELSPDFGGDNFVGAQVTVYDGNAPWDDDFVKTSRRETIKTLLSPLAHVPTFVCVGLNYKAHLHEAGLPTPGYPILFNKPSAALAGPDEDIPVHPDATLMDYEGELCVIIGKDCKDLTTDEEIDACILGYTVGNDVTSRFWQQKAQSGDQAGYSKGFDKFAPIGPCICSTTQIPEPGRLTLTTSVNGQERQRAGTDDLLFDVRALVRFASRGHTLDRGTVIMTGTPSGVGAFMTPPEWLNEGDVVEISISGIGVLRNRITRQG